MFAPNRSCKLLKIPLSTRRDVILSCQWKKQMLIRSIYLWLCLYDGCLWTQPCQRYIYPRTLTAAAESHIKGFAGDGAATWAVWVLQLKSGLCDPLRCMLSFHIVQLVRLHCKCTTVGHFNVKRKKTEQSEQCCLWAKNHRAVLWISTGSTRAKG